MDEYAKITAEYKKQQELKKACERSFAQILKEVSGGFVLGFWDIEFPISIDVDWGHRHSETVRYGGTKIDDARPAYLGEPEEEDGL